MFKRRDALMEKIRKYEPEASACFYAVPPEHWSIHVWGREIARHSDKEMALTMALRKLEDGNEQNDI